MQKQVEQIERELIERIYKLFLTKYNGNNSAFAKVSQCTETTVRRLFNYKQGMTINLLLRMAYALDVSVNDLLEGFIIKKED